MRADRLIQALLVLQSRASVTAAELAEELEVSVPTARRDLQALLNAGVPLYPQVGRGGGWRLVGGARTDLTGLTAPETFALALRLARSGADSHAAVRAERKMLRALPEPFRAAAQRVVAASVEGDAWGSVDPEPVPDSVELVRSALAEERAVRFAYDGGRDLLTLAPLVVGRRGRAWYLLAAPLAPGGDVADGARVRTYRLDRTRDLCVLPISGRAPEGFTPADAWREMNERVEALRSASAAVIAADAAAVAPLMAVFGRYAKVRGDAPGGRVRVEVRAHDERGLAEQLAGWSANVEVLEPPAVRSALAQIGARLVETYGTRRNNPGYSTTSPAPSTVISRRKSMSSDS